jgi:hypothetical protein
MIEPPAHSASSAPSLAGKGNRSIPVWLVAWLSICVIAILIMLPRLASPQFGLLDDGNSLRIARLLAAGQWRLQDVAGGRSRPLYWLFWSLPYLLAGPNPFWYFLANLASLIALVSCVFMLGRSVGMGVLPSWLAAVTFLLTGPVIENFYTLSKGEPIQLLLILMALILALKSSELPRSRARLAAWVSIPILTFLAGITKETVLVMIPISLVWLVAASLKASSARWIDRGALRAALIGFGIGGVCFLGYRLATVAPGLLGGGYASGFEFSTTRILDSGARWMAWLLRDFLFLLPLAFLPIVWGRRSAGPSRKDILLGSLIWMAGWLAIFLPWLFVAEYYLLPFSLGAAFFAAVLLGDAITTIRRRAPTWTITTALLILSALLFSANLANFWTVGSLQLAVDKANAAVVDDLAQHVPHGGTIIVNIQEPTEYVSQMGLHLSELYNRADVRVTHLNPDTLPTVDQSGDVFVAAPYIENQLLFSDRLGVNEPDVREWNESIADFLQMSSEEIYRQRADVRLLAIDPARVFCPVFAGGQAAGLPIGSILRYCQGGGLIDRQVFSYGWDVYRLVRR